MWRKQRNVKDCDFFLFMNSKHYQNVIIADKDIIFTSIIANNDIFKLSKQTLAILTPLISKRTTIEAEKGGACKEL